MYRSIRLERQVLAMNRVYYDKVMVQMRDDIVTSLYSLADRHKVDDFMLGFDASLRGSFENYADRLNDTFGFYGMLSRSNISAFIAVYENYYDCCNSVMFLYDAKKQKPSTEKLDRSRICNILHKFNGEGAIVNIDGLNLAVRINKHTYMVYRKSTNTEHDAYSINITRDNKAGILETISYILIPDLYPKLFVVDALLSGVNTDSLSTMSVTLFDSGVPTGDEGGSELNLYIVPYGSRNRQTVEGLYTEQLIRSVFECLEKYINRGTKRSTSKAITVRKRKLGTASKKSASGGFVTIREYTTYERKEFQGGTHASPCEHERSGTWRHCKSGKVVWVRGTTVNKGKEKKVIYKV